MTDAPFRVAVVGSGPSGSYCAQLLTEEAKSPVEVDVFERLPAPFGLVRYGVAPDHPRIKSIITSFAQVFEETPGVRYLGNVEVGRDVTLDELRASFDAVIFATGAPLDRQLGVPGEDLDGVHAVREFVSWYGGHPDVRPSEFDLTTVRRAVVIGVGNVALDAARMLVRSTDELRATDVPEHIVDAFAASACVEVTIVGRRGPAYAKFTNKEFIEFLDVEGCDVIVDPADLELDEAAQAHVDSDPAARRLFASFVKAAQREPAGRAKVVRFVFDRSPIGFVADTRGSLAGVELVKTSDPASHEVLEADLALRSVGYRGAPLVGLPFDESSGTVPHTSSRVEGPAHSAGGVYVVGWIKRGPTGVVGTNRLCALETITSVLEDLDMPGGPRVAGSTTGIDGLLESRGVEVVDWEAWKAIDAAEVAAGRTSGRERVKLHDRTDMLRAARDSREMVGEAKR